MWETWVRSLGWEDPLERVTATHSNILAWRIPWTISWDLKELDPTERLSLTHSSVCMSIPISQSILPFLPHLVTLNLFPVSEAVVISNSFLKVDDSMRSQIVEMTQPLSLFIGFYKKT